MQGIGEKISPITLPAFHAVLVNPGLSLSTPAVFQQLASKTNPALQPPPTSLDHSLWLPYLKAQRNDLEAPAIALCPTIAEVLQALAQQPGCALARMSGAGATCFGMFETDAAAHKAAQVIQARQPNWWVKPTRLA
jgi:4-diphosphocytidyl-2-C-methyl-D-erythritol kinase